MKYCKILILLLTIFFLNCGGGVRNRTSKSNCLIIGQFYYEYPNMVEEGLRELVLINLQNNVEINAMVFPYEFGYLVDNVPIGQYAVKFAKWVFIDARALAVSGIYRQFSIEMKFTSASYSNTMFEVKKGGVYYASALSVYHEDSYQIKKRNSKKLFTFLDKVKQKLKFSDWTVNFNEKLKSFFNKQKITGEKFLRKKFPANRDKTYQELIKKYIED